MQTIIKKLALYVSIVAIGAITATALIPSAHATSLADSIEWGLKQQCQTTFRAGDTQFIGTGCDEYSLIAINTERRQSLMIDPSEDVIAGFKRLVGTGLLVDYNQATKILAIDSSNLDVAALKKIYEDAAIQIQSEIDEKFGVSKTSFIESPVAHIQSFINDVNARVGNFIYGSTISATQSSANAVSVVLAETGESK